MEKNNEKSIFSQGNVEKTSYMNWRTDCYNNNHNYTVLGDGFSQAATILMDKILEDNRDKKGDVLIFPILYDIDQAIEVYIKATINVLNELLGNQPENMTSHDIKQLLSQMKSRVKKVENSTEGLQNHLKPLSSYIEELYGRIDYAEEGMRNTVHIDFARYPVTTIGTQHFYVKNLENEVVDIENLRERFTEAMDCLKDLYFMYSDMLDNLKEMDAEVRREAESEVCHYS